MKLPPLFRTRFRVTRVGQRLPRLGNARITTLSLSITLLTLGVVFSFAPTPEPTRVEAAPGLNEQINFQARILSAQGSLVADGDYNVRFRIYQGGDGALGGGDETLVWTEAHYDSNGVTAGNDNRVRVVNGYVSVQLNSICGSFTSGGCISNGGVDWNDDTLWLSIDIGGTTQTATPTYDGEMDPFIRFTSVPYAFNSDLLDGLDSTDLVQLGQGEQAANTAGTGSNALISVDQAGTGDLLNLQVSNATVLNLSNAGNLTVSGTAAFQGASISVGTANSTTGQLVFYDSNSANTITLDIPDMSGGSVTYTLPATDGSNTDCLVTDGSGNLSFSSTCTGSGGGGVTSLNTLSGALTIQGTTNEVTVATSSPNITLSLPDDVYLGDATTAGTLRLYDGSSNYAVIDVGAQSANLTWTLPTAYSDNAAKCVKGDTAGNLSFQNCNNGSGGGGAITLQDAYDAGNTISTDLNDVDGDISFTLADTATDRNFTITTADGATGYTAFLRSNGAGTLDPAQLVLIDNLDTDRSVADGLRVQSAAGGITDGIDVSDAELTNAINIGANAIAGTNFSVTGAGAITSVGINAGAGLIQGTGGLTASGTITFSSLTNCDTIDTDGSGVLSCGTDASGSGISGSGSSGQIAYWTGASTQAGSGNFIWDNASSQLEVTGAIGIGTSAPAGDLEVRSGAGLSTDIYIVADNALHANDTWQLNLPYNTGTLNFINNAATRFSLGETGVVSLTNYLTKADGDVEIRAPTGDQLNFILRSDGTHVLEDQWTFNVAQSGGLLSLINGEAGTTDLSLSKDGVLSVTNYITKSDGDIELRSNSGALDVLLTSDGFNSAEDRWVLTVPQSGGTLSFANGGSTDLTIGQTGVLTLTNYLTKSDGSIEVRAPAGNAANFTIRADGTHAVEDLWTFNVAQTGGLLSLQNGNSGSANLTLTQTGTLTLPAYASCGVLNTNASGVVSCGSAGSGEFTDGGTYLYPADNSGAEDIVVGGTTTATADIWLQAAGGAVFNEQGASVNFRVEGSGQPNALYVQGSTGNVGVGTAAPGASLDVDRLDVSSNTEQIIFRTNNMTQTITGALTNARYNQFLAPTITAATAQTVTNAATVFIGGDVNTAGSATITNNYGLWVDQGDVLIKSLTATDNFINDSPALVLQASADTQNPGSIIVDRKIRLVNDIDFGATYRLALRDDSNTQFLSFQPMAGGNVRLQSTTEIEVYDDNFKLSSIDAADNGSVNSPKLILQGSGDASAGGGGLQEEKRSFDIYTDVDPGLAYRLAFDDNDDLRILTLESNSSNARLYSNSQIEVYDNNFKLTSINAVDNGSVNSPQLILQGSGDASPSGGGLQEEKRSFKILTDVDPGLAYRLVIRDNADADVLSIESNATNARLISNGQIEVYDNNLLLKSVAAVDNTTVNSPDLIFQGSSDTISPGFTIENRTFTLRNIIDGLGNYRLSVLDNADAEFFTFEGETQRIGIGDSTPAAMLSVGSTSQFQVNTTGAIQAATGITSSGTITLSSLINCDTIDTNASGVLSCGTDDGGSGISGTGSAGQVAYWTGATSQAGSASFIWDNAGTDLEFTAGSQIGIGTTAPDSLVDIEIDGGNGFAGILLRSDEDDTFAEGAFTQYITGTAGSPQVDALVGTVGDTPNLDSRKDGYTGTLGWSLLVGTRTSAAVQLGTNANVALTVDTDQQIGIGTSSPDAQLEVGGNRSQTAWGTNGIALQVASAATYTDNSTAASGTAVNAVVNSFGRPTLAATNTSVTTTNAATLYVQNSPLAGTNQTITNPYSIWVDAGISRFDGDPVVSGGGILIEGSTGHAGIQLRSDSDANFAEGAYINLIGGNPSTPSANATLGNVGNTPGLDSYKNAYSNTLAYATLLGTDTSTALQFGTNEAVRLTVASGGNIGIGDTTPAALLTVGSADAFQVNSTGAIAAATGITSSGTITFSSLNSCGVLNTNASGVVSCGSAGSGEFTDGGTYLYPADNSGAEDIVVGGTTTAAADIWLQAAGGAVFNEQGASVNFRVEGSGQPNALYVQGSTGNVGVGTAAPGASLDVDRLDVSSNTEQIIFRTNNMTQTITAGMTNARFNQFLAPTITAATALSVENAATVYISGDVTNTGSATITNNYGLWINQGDVLLGNTAVSQSSVNSSPAIEFLGSYDSNTGAGVTAVNRKITLQNTVANQQGDYRLSLFNTSDSEYLSFASLNVNDARINSPGGLLDIRETNVELSVDTVTSNSQIKSSTLLSLRGSYDSSTGAGVAPAEKVVSLQNIIANQAGDYRLAVIDNESDEFFSLSSINTSDARLQTGGGLLDVRSSNLQLSSANVTAESQSINAPDLILEGSYDSDGGAGILNDRRSIALRNIVQFSGGTGTYRLALLDDESDEFISFTSQNVNQALINSPGGLLEVRSTDTLLAAAAVTSESQEINSPDLTFRGSYDSDGGAGITPATRSISLRNITEYSGGGLYRLGVFDNAGVEFLTFEGDTQRIGILDSTPSAALSVGSTSQFQVNTTGAIAAATGITSSGTITLSGLLNCDTIDTNASGVLSCGTDDGGGAAITLQDAYDNSTSPATITTSASTKDIIIQSGSTFDSTTALQVLDADGGNPVLNVDTVNERIGIGVAAPSESLDVVGNIELNGILRLPEGANTAEIDVHTGGGIELRPSGNASYGIVTTGGRGAIWINHDNSTSNNYDLLTVNGSSGQTGDYFQIVDSSSNELLNIDSSGNLNVRSGSVLANNTSTATTGNTESTARTNVTSITLDADSFNVNDVIFFDNAGQDYYTRVTVDNADGTYTVSPAVSYDADVTVTKYNIQNIGATATDYTTTSNRFFQGYFLGGVVTGAGSTSLSDGNLISSNGLKIQSSDVLNIQTTGNDDIVVTPGNDGDVIFALNSSGGSNNNCFDITDDASLRVRYECADDELVVLNTNVGIGTSAPSAKVDIVGDDVIVPAGPAGGTVTLEQTATGSFSTTSTATFGVTPTEGNLLIAIAGHRTDPQTGFITGEGWIPIVDEQMPDPGRNGFIMWYKFAGPSEPTAVSTSFSDGEINGLTIREFSVSNGETFTFDTFASNNSSNSTVTSLSTGTTATSERADSLVITGLFIKDNPDSTPTWTNSIGNVSNNNDGGGRNLFTGYVVNTSASTKESTASWTTARYATAGVAVFSIGDPETITPALQVQNGNVIATGQSSDLTDGSFVNSNEIILQGYYDSDATAGVTATARQVSLQTLVESNGFTRLAVKDNYGREFATFDSTNGRVGIGVTDPQYKFEVGNRSASAYWDDSNNRFTVYSFGPRGTSIESNGIQFGAGTGGNLGPRFIQNGNSPLVLEEGDGGFNGLRIVDQGLNSNATLELRTDTVQTTDALAVANPNGVITTRIRVNGGIDTNTDINTSNGGLGEFENHLTYSEDFGNAAWVTSGGVTVSTDTVTAPDGTTTADSIIDDGTGGGDIDQTVSTGVGAGEDWTFSVWLRGTSGTQDVSIELEDNGTPGTTNQIIYDVGTEWERFNITHTTTVGSTSITARLNHTSSASDTIYTWGAQLEKQSDPGAYIGTSATGQTTTARGLVVNGADVYLPGIGQCTGTNGGALTINASGQLVCTDDDGGAGGTPSLDDAYNNFGAVASKITVDAAEGQTGGLEFESTGANNIFFDLQGTGDFYIQESGDATPTFMVTDGGLALFNATANGGGIGSDNAEIFVQQQSTSNSAVTIKTAENGLLSDNGGLQVRTNDNETYFIVGSSNAGAIAALYMPTSETSDYLDVTSNGGTNGDVFTIKNSGRVGIGNSAPTVDLQVSNAVDANVIFDAVDDVVLELSADTDNSGEAGNPLLRFKQDGGSTRFDIGLEGTAGSLYENSLDNAAYVISKNGFDLQLGNDTVGVGAVVTILGSNGSIGINDNTPDADFDVVGNSIFTPSTDSTAAFQVQEAGGTDTLFAVDTTNNRLKVGNSTASTGSDTTVLVLDSAATTNQPTGVAGAMYYDTTAGAFYCYTSSWGPCDTTGSGGGITNTITNIPEFTGGTLVADGANNNGTISASFVSGLAAGQGYKHNYYNFASAQGTQQDYDVVVHMQVPSDYSSMGAASTFSFWHWDDDGTGTDAEIDWAVYDVDETQCFSTTDINATAADTWEQTSASSLGTCSFAANDIITFVFKLKTNTTGGNIRLGEFEFQYDN